MSPFLFTRERHSLSGVLAVGETPFILVYGTKAIISVAMQAMSPGIQYFDEEINEQDLLLHLDYIDEHCTSVAARVAPVLGVDLKALYSKGVP
ncbi:hypothetical protein ACLOJK_037860 [Asimina triloba]